MLKADLASLFGRHEFFIRRLHSFTGLIPVGGFMVFHLATNASIADGVEIFQYRVNVIHGLGPSTIMLLEWPFIFLPILFHAIVGMMIVSRGKRNVTAYPYPENIRYTLQRWTGVIAFFFIFWHVFHMHGWLKFEWWVDYVAKPLGGHQFDPARVITAAEAIQASIWIRLFYIVGVLCCVYHFVNGIWTAGITWGLWISPRAQRMASGLALVIGLFLGGVSVAALYGMSTIDTTGGRASATISDGISPPAEVRAEAFVAERP